METGGSMRIIESLKFDMPDERFELLERESGSIPHASANGEEFRNERVHGAESIGASIDETEQRLRVAFHTAINTDVIFRKFRSGSGCRVLLVYMNGMADDSIVSRFVIAPLMQSNERFAADIGGLLSKVIEIAETEVETDLRKVKASVMDGMTAVFIEGCCASVLVESRGFEKRSVSEAQNERIVQGPKESFTEALRTNITLLRRIVKTEDMIVEYGKVGRENKTRTALVYRAGFTDETLISEIKSRLARIKTDIAIGIGIIDQLIEDDSIFPIPRTLSTERPDRAASHLMNGSAVLLAEGSPFALVMPITLASLMNSPEDVYMRRPVGTLLRAVRYVGAAISVILPGYFIALAMYHQGLISTEVLSTIIKSREMVFEPLPFEMLLLLFVFQLIREAGMRVPGSIGQAIGVIGGLILGQAAVAANLASTVILIVVALSGLGNLCIPDYSTQVGTSYLRIAFVIAAWLGGLLGLATALMLFIAYMANVKSFGVPFLSPFAPKTFSRRPPFIRGRIGLRSKPADYNNTAEESALE